MAWVRVSCHAGASPQSSTREESRPITLANTGSFDEDFSKKCEKDKEVFHKFTAKGSFASKRARQDMAPIVSVSCARVKSPGQSDWNKSVRMMKFSHQTKDDILTLDAEHGLWNLEHWHADAPFAVHPDFKSHTGANQALSGGKGSVQGASAKQRLNTNSSTTSESVGVDQVLPSRSWTPLFCGSTRAQDQEESSVSRQQVDCFIGRK